MTGPAPSAEGWRAHGRSFGAVAGGYASLRPGYPADVVPFLLGDRPLRVLDLGAGTGLLTDRLVQAGHEVVAVDPSPEMLGELAARLPQAETVAGTAESVPLAAASVDAVVAGQAAHWFTAGPAAAELRRVLRPGGVVGFVWNTRDDRVPWVAALGELTADLERNHDEDHDVVVTGFAPDLDAEVTVAESGVVQRLTPEQVAGLMGTRSYVAVMSPDERAAFLDRIRGLLATHPDTRGRDEFDLPYRTAAYRLTPR